MVRYVSSRVFLVCLFFIALTLRFIFFNLFLVDNPCQLMYDSAHYHAPALNLAQGNGFTVRGKPYFYRFPGYSAFLAGSYKLFDGDVHKALLVQIFIAAFIPLLIFLLARLFFPQRIYLAYLASILAALHPGYLIFSGLVMTETLFVLFFTFFLYLFFLALGREQHNRVLFFAGLTLGFATYMRPVGHYFLLLAVCGLLCGWQLWVNKLKGIGGLVIGWSLIVVPWVLRNYWLTGYIFLHTLGGPHFMNHTAIPLVMKTYDLSWQEARNKVYGELKDLVENKALSQGRPVLEIEESMLAQNLAVSYMRQNPVETFKHAMQNAFKTIFSLYSSELLVIDACGQLPDYEQRTWSDKLRRFLWPQVHNKAIIAIIYYELLFFIFLLVGFVGFLYQLFFKEQSHREGLLCIVFMGLFIGLSLSCGFARLRLPYEALMIILSSYFWISYFNSVSGKASS